MGKYLKLKSSRTKNPLLHGLQLFNNQHSYLSSTSTNISKQLLYRTVLSRCYLLKKCGKHQRFEASLFYLYAFLLSNLNNKDLNFRLQIKLLKKSKAIDFCAVIHEICKSLCLTKLVHLK